MVRRALLAVSLAALLVVAGCAGTSGDSGDGDGGDYPAADAVDESLIEDHSAALADTSFTERMVTETNQATITQVRKLDPGDDQYLLESTGFGNSTTYTDGDQHYQRTVLEDQTQVSAVDSGVNTSVVGPSSQYLTAFVSANVTYERDGSTTFDGDDVARYTAEGLDALSEEMRNDVGENTTLQSFSGSVLVDGDGVIRKVEVDIETERDGQAQTASITVEVTDVGSTDVEEPDWVSQVGTTSA
mgnify:CR=1 FL=1